MPRPITAVIHRQALQNNLAVVRKAMPNSKVFAVVKANAYGHGIERVYDAFKAADGFALLDLDEAKRIRALGWTGPILLLEGIFSPQDLFDCVQYHSVSPFIVKRKSSGLKSILIQLNLMFA